MAMVTLPDVTLCCVDTRRHALAVRSLRLSMREIHFGRVLFLTDAVPLGVDVPDIVEVRKIERITSYRSYSDFMLKRLVKYVGTEHVLVTQWDGYVAHASEWDPAFLDCDYLGA